MKTGAKRLLLGVLAAISVVVPFWIRTSKLLFNYSDSVPIGIYQESPDYRGSYIVFCLPEAVLVTAQHNGLELSSGSCPGRISPILKPAVRATPEHPVILTLGGFLIDGRLLRNTAPKTRSRSGFALTHYPFGSYQSGLWAISDFSRDSFDSRYFGPVDPSCVRSHAVPVWTN